MAYPDFHALANKHQDDGAEEDTDDQDPVDNEDGQDLGGGEASKTGAKPSKQVYRLRSPFFRAYLDGIALSPGGAVSAVLYTIIDESLLCRGKWLDVHSSVEFDSWASPRWVGQAIRGRRETPNDGDYDNSSRSSTIEPTDPLSTEARMWEWMYGRGPIVPGVSAPPLAPSDAEGSSSSNSEIKALFQGLLENPKCDYCNSPLRVKGIQFVCPKRHIFDICGFSGLPIQQPGISRSCGVCGTRTLEAESLAAMFPDKEIEIRRQISAIKRCKRCGGKFID